MRLFIYDGDEKEGGFGKFIVSCSLSVALC